MRWKLGGGQHGLSAGGARLLRKVKSRRGMSADGERVRANGRGGGREAGGGSLCCWLLCGGVPVLHVCGEDEALGHIARMGGREGMPYWARGLTAQPAPAALAAAVAQAVYTMQRAA